MILIELEDRAVFLPESDIRSVTVKYDSEFPEVDKEEKLNVITFESSLGVVLFNICFQENSSARKAYRKIVETMKSEESIKTLDFKRYK